MTRLRRRIGGVDLANLRRVSTRSALTIAALQGAVAPVAILTKRRDYADAVWGPGLAAVAVVGALEGSGDRWRRTGLAVTTVGWAIRLERAMLSRVLGKDEEDGRYTEFLEGAGPLEVLLKVFGTQALAQLIVSAPLQVAAASRMPKGRRRWLVPLGFTVMVAGAVLEARADAEKNRYSARPKDERPPVLDTGLWGLSRHPNYFGDSLVWDGAWLTAAANPAGALTLPAPMLMTYFLMYATGAKRTEKIMADRPGYSDYQDRVSFFFPLPGGH